MAWVLEGAISAEALERVHALLNQAAWGDGARSAHGAAKGVKANRQLRRDDAKAKEAGRLLLGELERERRFRRLARPAAMLPPLFAQYDEGMGYGEHIDAPIMAVGMRARADLACSIFLDEGYEGGELVVVEGDAERRFAPPAGAVVLFEARHRHRVEVVRAGRRTVGVSWIQSRIPQTDRREALAELDEWLERLGEGAAPEGLAEGLARVHHNLVRALSR